jgi:hypothetical protein
MTSRYFSGSASNACLDDAAQFLVEQLIQWLGRPARQVRGYGRFVCGKKLVQRELPVGGILGSPFFFQAGTGGDPVKPVFEFGLVSESPEVPIDIQKGVLHHVFGVTGVVAHPQAKIVQAFLVTFDQFIKEILPRPLLIARISSVSLSSFFGFSDGFGIGFFACHLTGIPHSCGDAQFRQDIGLNQDPDAHHCQQCQYFFHRYPLSYVF